MTALERQGGKIKTRGNRVIVQTAEEIYKEGIINERLEMIKHSVLIALAMVTFATLLLTALQIIKW